MGEWLGTDPAGDKLNIDVFVVSGQKKKEKKESLGCHFQFQHTIRTKLESKLETNRRWVMTPSL